MRFAHWSRDVFMGVGSVGQEFACSEAGPGAPMRTFADTVENIMFKERFKADPNDLVIVVMGPTGSGKSNVSGFGAPFDGRTRVEAGQFINHFTGRAEHRRTRGLRSDTQDVTPHSVSYQSFRLVLVDTPGFDDTHRPDSETLGVIADWLVQKYPDGTTLKIAGIIYLHRITDNRVSGSVHKNLQVFGRLLGDIPLRRTRIVTTMWDCVRDAALATRRETELADDFWRPLIDGGAVNRRFYNSSSSAQTIVDDLLRMQDSGDDLLLQEELVEQQKHINETEAGRVLYSRLEHLLAEQKKTLKALAEEAKLQNDPALAKSLQEEYEKIDAQLRRTFQEMKEMKISFSRRVLLWLSGRKTRAKAVELGSLHVSSLVPC